MHCWHISHQHATVKRQCSDVRAKQRLSWSNKFCFQLACLCRFKVRAICPFSSRLSNSHGTSVTCQDVSQVSQSLRSSSAPAKYILHEVGYVFHFHQSCTCASLSIAVSLSIRCTCAMLLHIVSRSGGESWWWWERAKKKKRHRNQAHVWKYSRPSLLPPCPPQRAEAQVTVVLHARTSHSFFNLSSRSMSRWSCTSLKNSSRLT